MKRIYTYLKHDSQHGGVEGTKHHAVQRHRDTSKCAELAKTADFAVGADEEYSNLEGVVTENDVAFPIKGVQNDIPSRLHAAVLLGLERVRVCEDFAGQAERLLEADSADQERERLRQAHRVERDIKDAAEGQCEQECKDRGHHDPSREPEIGAERARLPEEVDEGTVHEDIADEDDEDVERVGLLRELVEAHDEGPQSVCDPLAALHLADALRALGALYLIPRPVDGERGHALERADPVLARAGGEAERHGRWGDCGKALERLWGDRRYIANRRVRVSRERVDRAGEALRDRGERIGIGVGL